MKDQSLAITHALIQGHTRYGWMLQRLADRESPDDKVDKAKRNCDCTVKENDTSAGSA